MTSSALPVFQFSNLDLPPEQQLAAWSVLLAGFDAEALGPGPGFEATAQAFQLGGVLFTIQKLDPVRMVRSRKRADADGLDNIVVAYVGDGSWVGRFNGRDDRLDVGEVCIFNMAGSMEAVCSASHSVVILIPHVLLDEALGRFPLHGMILRGPVAGVFTGFTDALINRLPNLTVDQATPLSRVMRDVLVGCIVSSGLAVDDAGRPSDSALIQKIRSYIDQHLTGALSADEISRTVGVSRSRLYRLFAPMGGVAAHIQRRRLAKTYTALLNGKDSHSIAEVAEHWGFGSHAHFSRVFRREFGVTPSEVRAASVLDPTAVIDADLQGLFDRWLDTP